MIDEHFRQGSKIQELPTSMFVSCVWNIEGKRLNEWALLLKIMLWSTLEESLKKN